MVSNREELAFEQASVGALGFLEEEYGYRRAETGTTLVRYESTSMSLSMYHGRRSYEVGVELGPLSSPGAVYRLPTILRALAPSYEGETTFQASTRDVVGRIVGRVVDLLKSYAVLALRGDSAALELIEETHRVESARITRDAQIGPSLVRADDAWREKRYEDARRLYDEFRDDLSSTRRRRLDYLLRRRSRKGQ